MDENAFKSFKYKAKLLKNTESHGVNGILKNTTIALPLMYLSNFEDHLECNYLIAKLNWNLCERVIVYCLQMVMTMIMLITIILFLLSKTQNHISL